MLSLWYTWCCPCILLGEIRSSIEREKIFFQTRLGAGTHCLFEGFEGPIVKTDFYRNLLTVCNLLMRSHYRWDVILSPTDHLFQEVFNLALLQMYIGERRCPTN